MSGFLGGRGGGAAAFSPVDIAGMVLWLKADALTGADGDAVTTWVNSAGGAVASPTQATAGAKPTLKTGILNSLPVVRFDGGDYLACSDAGMPTADFTLFLVGKTSVNLSFNTYVTAVCWGTNVNNQTAKFLWTYDVNAGQNGIMFDVKGTPIWFSDTVAAWRINAIGRTGTTAFIRRNEGLLTTKTLVVATVLSGANGLSLGSDNGSWSYIQKMTGDLAEIIVYGSAISAENRIKINQYLGAKWGIALA